jgi:hypothetical protein
MLQLLVYSLPKLVDVRALNLSGNLDADGPGRPGVNQFDYFAPLPPLLDFNYSCRRLLCQAKSSLSLPGLSFAGYYLVRMKRPCVGRYLPWHRLYFRPLPQGHFSLRPILRPACCFIVRFSSHSAQVQAAGCSVNQLALTMLPLYKQRRICDP